VVTRPAVAVVTTYYRPVLGGAEAAAERLAAYLHRRGHRVVVLTKRTAASHSAVETIDGVAVERLPPIGERSSAGKWIVLRSLYRALIRHRQDVDVVCCIDYRAIGLAALAARRRTGIPVIFQAQTEGVISGARVRAWFQHLGANPAGLLARLATWPIRAIYRRADALGCISRAIEHEALAEGVARERVHYLPNPIDTLVFSPVPVDVRHAIRDRLGVPRDALLAAFVGRLSREKGVIELVRAWALARPAAQLVLIGPDMTDHPWDVSVEARRIVAAENLGDSVRFVGGQPAASVASWLRAADFSVQPSHFEAMGLAAAEAMAAGLPVIASDTGGYRDFVGHERSGLLVPPHDVEALAAAIRRLTADPGLRARLGRQARATAEQFDETVVLERFADIIDQLAARRLAGRR
jgi:glycosyltransferase involved in cell wall biosynthesis